MGSAVHVIDSKLGWEDEWLVLPALKTKNRAGKFSGKRCLRHRHKIGLELEWLALPAFKRKNVAGKFSGLPRPGHRHKVGV